MKRLLLVPLLFITLAGCAQFKEVLSVATTTITNPVDAVDIYRVKNLYAATLQAAVDWRVYCYSKPYASIVADPIMKPVCQNRRAVVRAIQANQPKAASAIKSAQDFVTNNPTLNASTVITAAWSAVSDFKNAIPAVSN